MKKIVVFCLFLMSMCFIPFNVHAQELLENAVSGMLIEASTGKVIYEKNINEKVAVASMTKMVAQIIIMEEIEKGTIKWDYIVTVSKNAADMGGSQIYLAEGEKMSIRDLMKGISVASGNDATVAMAEVISGSEEKFVERMNKKVKELGLKNTQFKNCTGLDEDGHYSTAYDMAVIAKELVNKHPGILKFSSIYEDYLRENTNNKFWLVNTNKLIRFYDGADGLKTGHTDDAGYCLAVTAKKYGLRLIGIVLGEKESKVRNNEAMKLLDYGFNNVRLNLLKDKNEVVDEIKMDKANKDKIKIVLKDELFVVEDVGSDNKDYSYEVELNNFKLPVKVGDVVGKIYVKDGNKKLSSADLTVSEDIKPLSFIELLLYTFKTIVNGNI